MLHIMLWRVVVALFILMLLVPTQLMLKVSTLLHTARQYALYPWATSTCCMTLNKQQETRMPAHIIQPTVL